MGLDLHVATSDEEVAFASRIGSYSSFDEFRKAWAKLLGFNLEDMDGYGGRVYWNTQPLQCFFDHSDCDGEISYEDAKTILEQALKDAPELPEYRHEFGVLIQACLAAAKERMPIEFC